MILFGPQSKIHALLIYLCCSNSFSLTLEKANFLRKLIFLLEVLNYSKEINAVSDFKNSGGVRYFEWLKSTIPIPYLEFYPDTTFFESPRHFYLPPHPTTIDAPFTNIFGDFLNLFPSIHVHCAPLIILHWNLPPHLPCPPKIKLFYANYFFQFCNGKYMRYIHVLQGSKGLD